MRTKVNPKKGEEPWRRPVRKRDKGLCREMDEVVIARPISTDRKFLESLADKERSGAILIGCPKSFIQGGPSASGKK